MFYCRKILAHFSKSKFSYFQGLAMSKIYFFTWDMQENKAVNLQKFPMTENW